MINDSITRKTHSQELFIRLQSTRRLLVKIPRFIIVVVVIFSNIVAISSDVAIIIAVTNIVPAIAVIVRAVDLYCSRCCCYCSKCRCCYYSYFSIEKPWKENEGRAIARHLIYCEHANDDDT